MMRLVSIAPAVFATGCPPMKKLSDQAVPALILLCAKAKSIAERVAQANLGKAPG
jgi:hypothetical protein